MELSDAAIMDLTLNTIGYLAAGLLTFVIYSMFRRQPAAVQSKKPVVPVKKETASNKIANENIKSKPTEFVSFNSESSEPVSSSGRRNRGEVVRLAREMLQSGNSPAKVRQLLPISEVELSMLVIDK